MSYNMDLSLCRTQTMTPLPPLKRPLVVLTPVTSSTLSQEDLQALRVTVLGLVHPDKTYSVTFSPVLCPEGENWLFTLKPYYWEVEPGRWERRDGYRNPYCDRPQGQRQLEMMALAVRDLSLAVKYLPDLAEQAQRRATDILRVFFLDPKTRMHPEVRYAQCNPGDNPLKGDSCFVIACRFLLLVSQSLPRLNLDPQVEKGMHVWLENHVRWFETSEQGAEARGRGNNITVWYHAVLESHRYYLDPSQGSLNALRFFKDRLQTHSDPPAFLHNELGRAQPRHYVLFTLEPTFILAGLTGNPPPPEVLGYLDRLVGFAQTVQPGPIEVERDNDERYFAKLRSFEQTLALWKGLGGKEGDDGSANT